MRRSARRVGAMDRGRSRVVEPGACCGRRCGRCGAARRRGRRSARFSGIHRKWWPEMFRGSEYVELHRRGCRPAGQQLLDARRGGDPRCRAGRWIARVSARRSLGFDAAFEPERRRLRGRARLRFRRPPDDRAYRRRDAQRPRREPAQQSAHWMTPALCARGSRLGRPGGLIGLPSRRERARGSPLGRPGGLIGLPSRRERARGSPLGRPGGLIGLPSRRERARGSPLGRPRGLTRPPVRDRLRGAAG